MHWMSLVRGLEYTSDVVGERLEYTSDVIGEWLKVAVVM